MEMEIEISKQKIIIIFLLFLLTIYFYNDILKPFIKKLITNKTSNIITEAFTQYSSLTNRNSLSNTVQFDTNYYLRDPHKAIVLNNKIALPLLKYGYYDNDGYDDLVGKYMRKHIYPTVPVQVTTNIEAIYKFINGDIDMAFINEELLSRYYKRDCKYLTNLLANSFDLKGDLDDPKILDRLYPPLNIEAIGVGYYEDVFLIVNNFSNIIEYLDIENKKIGVLADSYYYYIKICNAYGLDPDKNSTIEQSMENLIKEFKADTYDAIFVVTHPKNKQLVQLSQDKKVRYIHIQKRAKIDVRNNLENITTLQQGNNSEIQPPPPDINRQAIYSKAVMADLKTENIRENFNKIIRKYFKHLIARTVDLNKFHRSGNMYTYLDTYATRMILVIRKEIPMQRVEFITRNYIDHLEKMRNFIDKKEFNTELNNFSSHEFKYEELVSFDQMIPMSAGARKVYKDEGLVYYEDEYSNKI
jgi:TRAP-type uncharacterized transport system substrate-binding protein